MNHVVPTLSFIGRQGSGKTTLLTRLIPILMERGYRVGTVKHAPREFGVDQPGKDSFCHRRAGAERTLVISGSEYALFSEPPPGETAEEAIDRLFAGFDVVLVEGFKHGPFPKIEVYRSSGTSVPPLAEEIEVLAVITDQPVNLPEGMSILSPHKPERIAEFIERRLL